MGLFELNFCAFPLTVVGSGGGPSGAAHPSVSCAMVFIKIAADLESQLEIVSEVRGESIGFSSDGRWSAPLHGTGDAAESRLCAVPSQLRGRTGPCDVGDFRCFAKVKQPSATRAARSAWSRCKHQSQSSPCQAAQSHQKAMCLTERLDLAEVLAKLATVLEKPESLRSLEEEFGVDPSVQQRKRSTPRFSTTADQEGEGSSDWVAMPRCSTVYAPVTITLESSLRRTKRECGKMI